jgi:hypothetical protein
MTDQQQPPADFGLQLYICRYKKQAAEGQAAEGQAEQSKTWSSIIEFNGPISDSGALTLLILAYDEMVTKACPASRREFRRHVPGAMTALIIPATAKTIVILASSMKKTSGHESLKSIDYLYADQRLKKALDKAIPSEMRTKYPTHQRACGELVAYHVWLRLMCESGKDLKILTWGTTASDKSPCVKPPCTNRGTWGCKEFVEINNITPIIPGQAGPAPSLSLLPTFEVLNHPGFSDVEVP